MSGTRCQVLNKFVPVIALGLAATLYFNDAKIDYYLLMSVTVLLTLAHIHYGLVVVSCIFFCVAYFQLFCCNVIDKYTVCKYMYTKIQAGSMAPHKSFKGRQKDKKVVKIF